MTTCALKFAPRRNHDAPVLLLDHAAENDYGLAAFNVNNMEQIQAIMEAAKETDSPVIVQASPAARSYRQDNYLRHLMIAAAELYPQIPIAMHQDHGNSPDTCKSAIANGFTSVMMDGSLKADGKTPADFDYNVAVTKEVVEAAHAMGVSVEGELGCLGSLEHGGDEMRRRRSRTISCSPIRTKPNGSSPRRASTCARRGDRHQPRCVIHQEADRRSAGHGSHRRDPSPAPNCHRDARLEQRVPQDLQDVINQFGGSSSRPGACRSRRFRRHQARRPQGERRTRTTGWRFTGAIRKVLAETPEKFDPRDYLKPARDAMKKVCVARMTSFGQAGWGSKIKPVSIDKFASYYAMV